MHTTADISKARANLKMFISTLEVALKGTKVMCEIEMTESNGITATLYLDPFHNERVEHHITVRKGHYMTTDVRGYRPTPSLKKRISMLTRTLKKIIRADENVQIGLDGRLDAPKRAKDWNGDVFYVPGRVYSWEIFVYND